MTDKVFADLLQLARDYEKEIVAVLGEQPAPWDVKNLRDKLERVRAVIGHAGAT